MNASAGPASRNPAFDLECGTEYKYEYVYMYTYIYIHTHIWIYNYIFYICMYLSGGECSALWGPGS